MNLNFIADFLGWLIIANFLFILFRVFIFGGVSKSSIYKIHHSFLRCLIMILQKPIIKA
jgi:hypothetical protein